MSKLDRQCRHFDFVHASVLLACVYLSNVTSVLISDHIFEKVSPAMESLGLMCQCLGGGKIEHNSTDRKLRVFGESTVSHGWSKRETQPIQ